MRKSILRILVLISIVAGVISTSAYSTPIQAREQHRLFFSEYIEGSSNNKALEIYNGYATPDPIDLTYFEIRGYQNGSGSSSYSCSFPAGATLASGEVYVIAHGSADQAILDEADTTCTLQFNGNDAVELVQIKSFEDDSAIDDRADLIGVIGDDTTYAINTTLVRQSDKVGVDVYDSSEWDTYSQDTFTYLGSHSGPSPTAITLSSLSAHAATPWTGIALAGLLLGALVLVRRKR